MNSRRGALLLEMMLALTLFLGAAGMTLLAIQDGLRASDRAAHHARALDLASSTIASLESGVEYEDDDALFLVEVERGSSGHDGLTRVEVRVLDRVSEKNIATLVTLLPSEAAR